jgi:pyridoxamine 5'-phosphate oxidase
MEPRELREADVVADPLEQLQRWVDEARAAGVDHWDAMVVATADATGAPSARFVLWRGLDQRGLRFYSSYDSAKARDLAENPRAALALHWPEQGRQIRVTGAVSRLSPEESVEYWRNRPAESRLSAWASHQSEVIDDRSSLEGAVDAVRARFPDEIPLPPFWGGYLVEPDEVEFWQHRDDRLHDRLRYRRDPSAGWRIERLQP